MLESILKTQEHKVENALKALNSLGDPLQMADLAEIGMFEILESLHSRGDYNHDMLDLTKMMMLLRDYFLALAMQEHTAEKVTATEVEEEETLLSE